jgi:hypothetical protein
MHASPDSPTIAALVRLVRTFTGTEEVIAAGYMFGEADDYRPGNVAVVMHRGKWYRGVIVHGGTEQVSVVYVTPTAVTRSEQSGEPIRTTTAQVPIACVAVSRAQSACRREAEPALDESADDRRELANREAGQAFAQIIAAETGRVARPAPHENPRMWARARLAHLGDVVKAWETIIAVSGDAPRWARYAAEQQIETARRETTFLASLIG